MLRKLLDSPWTFAVPALVLALLALWATVDLRVPGRSWGGIDELRELRERDDVNLVFILIDTLRADRLGSYGYERPTSRFLDGLAAGGIRFERVEAASSWTKSSMASLWTGLDPVRTGILRFNQALPDQALMPAEILRDAGFATIGIYRNGWVGPNFGFSQGFEDYLKPGMVRDSERVERRPGAHLIGTDESVTRSALAYLDSSGHERFMLYLHYMDVHQYAYDGIAANEGFGTGYRDNYDSSIHWVDRNVGVVLEALENRDLRRRTIVVVASDHGEEFLEHGLEGHARTLYTEVTHVPWLISLPFQLPVSAVVESVVRNVDIWPTLLDLLGLPALPDADGRSLVPEIEAAIEGTRVPEAPPAISYLDLNWGKLERGPNPIVGIRHEGRSVIVAPKLESAPFVGVFDVVADPAEQSNLAAEGAELPDWVEALDAQARTSIDATPPWGEVPEVELDELSRTQLKALGYVFE
ncbi:MAG: sulfatase [Myxococcota bacterium]